MTIENPHANRLNEQGGVMPPEEVDQSRGTGEIPYQQTVHNNPDTYHIPQTEEEEPGFLKRHWGKVALATAGVVAAGAYYLGNATANDSEPKNIPDTGSQPVATAEQHPGGSAPATSAEAPASSPEANPADTGVSFGSQHMTVETAKATLFEVSGAKAPSPNEAAKQWAVALQNGMKMNASREAVSQNGGVEATEKANLDLLTGADGILLGLGKDHNSVTDAGADFMQPATLVYEANKANVENETFSRVYLTNMRVTGSESGGYTVLGDLTVTTMRGEEPLSSRGYKAEIHQKLDPQTNKWDYTGSHVLKDNG
ncbi:MAG TPA: hypothetical protein VFH06_01165 [Candidatus Saccharimonadales bacterium]|nr:hypothetical protein [Candidatus Saccharimonadales bacterium]